MKTITTTQRHIDSLKFHQMPQDGGQIVDTTYATDEDGIWEHNYDRSDRSSSYYFARYYARATERSLRFEPQNGILPSHNKWQKVNVEK